MNQSKAKRLRKELREKMRITKVQASETTYKDVSRSAHIIDEDGNTKPIRRIQRIVTPDTFRVKYQLAKRAWNRLSSLEREGLVRSANVA